MFYNPRASLVSSFVFAKLRRDNRLESNRAILVFGVGLRLRLSGLY